MRCCARVLPLGMPRLASVLLSLLLACGASAFSAAPSDVAADADALIDFYAATGGATRWLQRANWTASGVSICSWYGVTCACTNGAQCRVAGLALTGNQLTGALPPSLFTLGRLDTINLYEPQMYISAA